MWIVLHGNMAGCRLNQSPSFLRSLWICEKAYLLGRISLTCPCLLAVSDRSARELQADQALTAAVKDTPESKAPAMGFIRAQFLIMYL